MDSSYPYIASLPREPFLFYEMRTVAKLMCDGLSDAEVVSRVEEDNLFQYPPEKTVVWIARACIKRLKRPTETILFNIDIESFITKDKTAVLRVFAKMFYNHLGFYGENLQCDGLQHFRNIGSDSKRNRI